MKARAILNPRAGLAARQALHALENHSAWRGIEVLTTKARGDARAFASEAAAAGSDVVLSVGGDGTANEAAWGLIGSETALGLIPMGSGNGLARTLGIPLRAELAVEALARAVRRRMDVGMVNGRPFLNVAGAGFDAEIGADFHAHGLRGGRRGVFTYVRLSLRRTWSYRAEQWSLHADDGAFEGRALVVAFVNGRQYGGGAIMAPGARLDDGLLDVIVIEDAPPFEMAWNSTRLFLGNIEGFRRYKHYPASTATLEGPGPFVHHRDGEPEGESQRLEVSVNPLALTILVPAATANDPAGPFRPAGA